MKYFYKGDCYDDDYVEVTAEQLNKLNETDCCFSNTCIALVEIKGNEMYFEYFEGNG